MDCKVAKDYINLYVDNMLNDTEKEQLFLHIQYCKDCKKELNDSIVLKSAFSNLDEYQVPEGLAAFAIRKAKKRRFPIFAYASVGVAVAVALVVVLSSSIVPNDSSMDKDMMEGSKDESVAFSAMIMEEAAEEEPAEFEMPMADEEAACKMPESDTLNMQVDCTAEEASDNGTYSQERTMCRFLVNQEMWEEIHSFIEEYGIVAEYDEGESVISFTVSEACFADFKLLVTDMLYEGDLYPNCFVEFVFIE